VGEDDEGVRALSREVLEQHGYRVIEAVDGEDSVRKFVENKEIIDILLLDVVMPKKNGRMVYEEIHAIRPDIKVLFMSGYTSDIMEEKGVDMDEVPLINKPVSPSELLKRLREALDGD
jgi:DNA-binding response OmpR family regulator